jgi:hypothetical protein
VYFRLFLFIFPVAGTDGPPFCFFINRGGLVVPSLNKKNFQKRIEIFLLLLFFFFFIDQRISAVSDGECVGRHHAMPPIPTTTIAQLKRLPVTNSSFDSDLHVCFGNCFLLFSFVLLFIPFGCFDGKEQKKKGGKRKHVMQEPRMTQEWNPKS